MITFRQHGDFTRTTNFFMRLKNPELYNLILPYAERGVAALSAATPVDTGETSKSWYYAISIKKGKTTITFANRNIQNGFKVAILLQYGHGTRFGGYVQGRDYINPALRPVFDQLADEAWKEVISA